MKEGFAASCQSPRGERGNKPHSQNYLGKAKGQRFLLQLDLQLIFKRTKGIKTERRAQDRGKDGGGGTLKRKSYALLLEGKKEGRFVSRG